MGCFGGNARYTDDPIQYDPLGRTASGSNTGATGGPEARTAIFDTMQGSVYPKAQAGADAATSAAYSAASDPAWNQISRFGQETLDGRYLNSQPALDRALASQRQNLDTKLTNTRDAATANAAGQAAAARSGMARAGMGYSTAAQQVDQGVRAATEAQVARGEQEARTQQAATEAAAKLGAYQTERQNQMAAPSVIQAAKSAPLSYLSTIANTQMAPLSQAAQVVQGLAGNGQIVTPNSTVVKQAGVQDYLMGAGGMAAGAGY